jgi:hypothetical protein
LQNHSIAFFAMSQLPERKIMHYRKNLYAAVTVHELVAGRVGGAIGNSPREIWIWHW